MAFRYTEHASRSRFVEAFWSTVDLSDGRYVSAADACWDLIVVDTRGPAPTVLLSGPSTAPQEFAYRAGRHNLGIRFRVGVRVLHEAGTMQDRTVALPTADGRMRLAGSWRPVPTEVGALEVLVHHLEEDGALLSVRLPLEGGAAVRDRSALRAQQRRVAGTLGLSDRRIRPILRARLAANRLAGGGSIADVVWSLGYADQSHLTRDLGRFTGTTPRQAGQRGELV
jgi:hypothetical protein